MSTAARVRHLYVHLPFCAHRCGYCDFVTLVGRKDGHAGYVDGLLGELDLERGVLADPLDTVFLGGGTPTFTQPRELERHHFFPSWPMLRTARNASCGTSTAPTCFIRFFPAFCFSSSFRLRVMSPP